MRSIIDGGVRERDLSWGGAFYLLYNIAKRILLVD